MPRLPKFRVKADKRQWIAMERTKKRNEPGHTYLPKAYFTTLDSLALWLLDRATRDRVLEGEVQKILPALEAARADVREMFEDLKANWPKETP